MEMKKSAFVFYGLLVGLMMISFVSAYGYYGGYGYGFFSLEQLFNSPWFSFAIVFILFYAVLFFATKKAFREDITIAIIISAVLSLLITYALWSKGLIDFYAGSETMDLLMILGIAVIVILFVKFLFKHESSRMAAIALFAIWAISAYLYYTEQFPFDRIGYSNVLDITFAILYGWIGAAVFIITSLVLYFKHRKKRNNENREND